MNIDFIGVGFSKCGSTWIFECLKEHPQICVSSIKETMFFSRKYHKGFNWYNSLFQKCPKNQSMVIGEYTPDYAYYPEVLERIRTHNPNVKIIFVVRNQFERLRSMWRYQYVRGIHSCKNFEDYLVQKPDKVLERGLYYRFMQPYLEAFSQDQVLVISNDEIKTNPDTVTSSLYNFLEVDPKFSPQIIKKKINASTQQGIRFLWLNRFLHKTRHLMRATRLGRWLISVFEIIGLKKIIIRVESFNRNGKEKDYKLNDHISIDTEKRIENYYSEDTKALSKALQIDFSKLIKIHTSKRKERESW